MCLAEFLLETMCLEKFPLETVNAQRLITNSRGVAVTPLTSDRTGTMMIAETGRWWAVGGGYGRLLRLCVPRRHTNTNPEAAPASRTDVLEAGTVRF